VALPDGELEEALWEDVAPAGGAGGVVTVDSTVNEPVPVELA
jgi:hypothetical protein